MKTFAKGSDKLIMSVVVCFLVTAFLSYAVHETFQSTLGVAITVPITGVISLVYILQKSRNHSLDKFIISTTFGGALIAFVLFKHTASSTMFDIVAILMVGGFLRLVLAWA